MPVLGDLAALYGRNVDDLFDADDPGDPVTAFAEQVRKLVDGMPPLSPERRSRLRVLLRGIAAPTLDNAVGPVASPVGSP